MVHRRDTFPGVAMAIKVINPQPHPSVVKQAICRNCGAMLEYTPNDVREDYSSDYTGGRDYYRYIPCPQCNKQVHV